MDIAAGKWLSEMGMDDYKFIHQCHINSLAEFTAQNMATTLLGENLQRSFSSESFSSKPSLMMTRNTTITSTSNGSSSETSQTSIETPGKQQRTNSWNSSFSTLHQSPKPTSSFSTPHQSPKPPSPIPESFSFNTSAPPPTASSQQFYGNLDRLIKPKDEAASPINMHFQTSISKAACERSESYAPEAKQGIKRPYSMTRSAMHVQDHIMAERKRRKKLSQQFIALSAVVPGLKKMDKASVLEGAMKYMKQLQEQLKQLQDQTKTKTMESVVLLKKSKLSVDDECSSSDENFDGLPDSPLPEIEARTTDKDVLIRIHCKNQQGVGIKILSEIENLHLSVVNSSVLVFGNSTLDVTVIAQMDNDFSLTMKDLVKKLRLACMKLSCAIIPSSCIQA
ncbi:PREDICTED: transcription factor bHLH18 [Populus euphratica]|uniref:Transcription factor bHLH18 n=1 Tax=Populus euphratica TaxID=75702 RepID=A0AAJ6XKB1_POPEU|nr:PREDICTED: transcription factor bHLH18 [Populus euphratica]XP_011021823.1 PREDICTED: transcription factor bHLH18 [Populus euphratica]XP_011021824.1 PREDICTED: transcription factor bHLH18 [Populus euphratica]